MKANAWPVLFMDLGVFILRKLAALFHRKDHCNEIGIRITDLHWGLAMNR